MKKIISLFSLLLLFSLSVRAQEFSIKKIEITPDQVIIHYDLIDTTRYRTYTVRVYSSADNFLAPLTKVSGHVSSNAIVEVAPGTNKKIVWNSKEELGVSFIGNLELEVRGRVYIPFIRLVGLEDVTSQKRTVPFTIKWTGGSPQNVLSFQLYNKANKLVYAPPNVPNELQHKMTIPKSVKPGKGYYFKISDSKNADQVVFSPSFNVKPKYPLTLKTAAVMVVGGGIYYLINSLADKNKDIKGPPDPPTDPN